MIPTVGLLPAKFVKQAAGLMKAIQPDKYRSKMKVSPLIRTLFPVAVISMAAALPAHAQMIANALTNGDFETQNPQLTATQQTRAGFGALTGFQNISAPGTSQTGTAQTENSGIQGTNYATSKAESGSFFVFEQGQDPGAFQITGTTLTAGEQLTLTWYAADSYLSPVQEVGILTATSAASAFTAATQVAVANGSTNNAYALTPYVGNANPGPYSMYTLTYTATAADAGKNVGIFFENIGPANNFINTDNYDLAITSAVPEPGTSCMVIMGVGGALLVIRRRKQTLSRNLCA